MKSIEFDKDKEHLIGLKRKDHIIIHPKFFVHLNTDDLKLKLKSEGADFEDFSNMSNNSLLTINKITDLPDMHLMHKIWLDTKAALLSTSKGAVIIFLLSLLIMLFWELEFIKKRKLFQYLPGSLVAVFIGAVLAYLFNNNFQKENYFINFLN